MLLYILYQFIQILSRKKRHHRSYFLDRPYPNGFVKCTFQCTRGKTLTFLCNEDDDYRYRECGKGFTVPPGGGWAQMGVLGVVGGRSERVWMGAELRGCGWP